MCTDVKPNRDAYRLSGARYSIVSTAPEEALVVCRRVMLAVVPVNRGEM